VPHASGYFARVTAIRQLLLQFLAAGGAAAPPKQARRVGSAAQRARRA
jgi:hypothetical protein